MDFVKKRKRLTEPESQFYMMQLLDGMVYMHGKNVIHRDLKLGNIFIDEKMNLKIADFGLAAQILYDGERKKCVPAPSAVAVRSAAPRRTARACTDFAVLTAAQDHLRHAELHCSRDSQRQSRPQL